MLELSCLVTNKIGVHLRAAGEFVKVASKYSSKITVFNGSREANGKSILGLASLAIPSGTSIMIRIEGKDEKQAGKALDELIKMNFNED
ncbi:MAG: HPr family phosphocarrier protein [Candidatus Latescibacterota bacterium]